MRTRSAAQLGVGYGQADLNPPPGGSMPGYFGDRKAAGTLDPLRARSIFVQFGPVEGAIVALDLIGLQAGQVAACRAEVAKVTGIPTARVWVHASHTHTGAMILRSFVAADGPEEPGFYPGEVDPGFTAALPGRVAEAVRLAKLAARPTSARLGEARAEGFAHYRRYRMRDGTVKTNPARTDPTVIKPAGEVDPTLTAIGFPEAKTLVAIFGLHPDTVGGNRYSADYPAHLADRARAGLGEGWNVLFLNAACGNINHIDRANPAQTGGDAEARRIGTALGDAALNAWGSAERAEVDVLAFASLDVPSRLRSVPEADLNEAERLLRDEPAKATPFNGLHASAARRLGRTQEREQTAEIAALRLGPIGLVGMPGEIFVELARQVRHDSTLDPTRVIGLTNGALGYIPHAEAYAEGGYEAGYRSARFEPQTGHRWAEAALRLLKSLS